MGRRGIRHDLQGGIGDLYGGGMLAEASQAAGDPVQDRGVLWCQSAGMVEEPERIAELAFAVKPKRLDLQQEWMLRTGLNASLGNPVRRRHVPALHRGDRVLDDTLDIAGLSFCGRVSGICRLLSPRCRVRAS